MKVILCLVERAASIWGISENIIYGEQKSAKACEPRHAVMAVAVKLFGISTPKVGRALGNREHSSVVHGVQAALRHAEKSPDYARKLDELTFYARSIFPPDSMQEDLQKKVEQVAAKVAERACAKLLLVAKENPAGFDRLIQRALTYDPTNHF